MGTPISGLGGSVVVGTVVVGEISEWSLDINMSPTEVTAFGDDWKRSIPNIRAASGSFSGNFAADEAGQTTLRSAMLGGQAVALKLFEGTAFWTVGTALLTGHGNSLSHQGKAEVSYDFEPSGPVTYGA